MRDLDSSGDVDHWVQLCSASFSRCTRDPSVARSGPSLRREQGRRWGGRACNLITNGLETGIVWDLCTMGAADQHATACCLGSCQFTWDPSIHIPTFPAADVLQSVRL
jgi:hypothetical protein